MKREIHRWWSPRLQKDMDVVVYGHWGFSLLLFPTAAADFLEYERFQLIDAMRPLIEEGKVKIFSINSINNESWLHSSMMPHHKALRHMTFNYYVTDEVLPFIRDNCKGNVDIVTAGASFGALHAANIFFRRPDLFKGTIAMSGVYDLKAYTKGYYDENVYFNSPEDYIKNLSDHALLEAMRLNKKIIIATGQGAYEDPQSSIRFSQLLWSKGIPNDLEVWGHDITHDWPTWRKMLPYFVKTRF